MGSRFVQPAGRTLLRQLQLADVAHTCRRHYTYAQVLEDHARPVLSLAVADDKLFSGSYDYTIKVSTLT